MTGEALLTGQPTPRQYRGYPKYKHSGVAFLGDIPAHWDIKRLKFVAGTVAGQSPPSTAVAEGSSGLAFLQGNADFGAVHPTPRQVCDSASKRADPGDILLSVRAPVGALNIADRAYGIGRGLCAIRPRSSLDPDFCFYQMLTMRSLLDPVAKGSTYNAVTSSDVGNLPMLLPRPREQRDIAGFLDRETAKIDALATMKAFLIQLLEEKRTAIITHAVTRGLDPDVSRRESGVEWLAQTPAHWNVWHLRRVIARFVDYRGRTPEKSPSGTPLVTAKNIKNLSIDFSLSEEFIPDDLYAPWMVRGLPERGDVLLTTEAPLGESAQVVDASIALAQRIILLKADTTKIANGYLKYHFAADSGRMELRTRATGSTALGIKASHLKASLVAVPPGREQEDIAYAVDRGIGETDKLIAKIRQAIDHLNEFRIALISAAVTGRIDVREAASQLDTEL